MRAISILLLMAVVWLSSGHVALAEGGTCPAGYYPVNSPGVMGCAPIPGYGQDDEPIDPGPQWESRWGAVAAGSGGFGSINDSSNRRAAEKAALKQCKATATGDGARCKVYTFANTCAALVWGVDAYSWQVAGTIEKAVAAGMNDCGKMTTDCQVFYSACNYPMRVR